MTAGRERKEEGDGRKEEGGRGIRFILFNLISLLMIRLRRHGLGLSLVGLASLLSLLKPKVF